jgi:hypothetical protein
VSELRLTDLLAHRGVELAAADRMPLHVTNTIRPLGSLAIPTAVDLAMVPAEAAAGGLRRLVVCFVGTAFHRVQCDECRGRPPAPLGYNITDP